LHLNRQQFTVGAEGSDDDDGDGDVCDESDNGLP